MIWLKREKKTANKNCFWESEREENSCWHNRLRTAITVKYLMFDNGFLWVAWKVLHTCMNVLLHLSCGNIDNNGMKNAEKWRGGGQERMNLVEDQIAHYKKIVRHRKRLASRLSNLIAWKIQSTHNTYTLANSVNGVDNNNVNNKNWN